MVVKCEMCGAPLDINKAINGVVTCEYCDSPNKMQGFVHLNMSNNEKAAALLKRGFVFLEFKVWDKAKYVLSKAADYDPENAMAYLGLLMVDTEVSKEEQLATHARPLSSYENYQRALQFADAELKRRLESYNDDSLEEKWQQEMRKKREQQKIEAEMERNATRVLMTILFMLLFGSIIGTLIHFLV